jgi:hypothetical protein
MRGQNCRITSAQPSSLSSTLQECQLMPGDDRLKCRPSRDSQGRLSRDRIHLLVTRLYAALSDLGFDDRPRRCSR